MTKGDSEHGLDSSSAGVGDATKMCETVSDSINGGLLHGMSHGVAVKGMDGDSHKMDGVEAVRTGVDQ